MADQKIYIFALAASGNGISGSDRIFIEFAREWSIKHQVIIYLWEDGYRMCKRQALNGRITYEVVNINSWKFGFLINYLIRIIKGIKIGLTLKINDPQAVLIYSASEFWMDSIPAFLLKVRYPKIKWVAAWYQTAPNPLRDFIQDFKSMRYRLSAFVYWIIQFSIKPIIGRFSDYILVNNREEKKAFGALKSSKKILVILGAVNIEECNKWRKKIRSLPKIYDAVFQGRFHPQKGVLGLLHIWNDLLKIRKDARLALIGDGPLMNEIKYFIHNNKLDDNIKLFGYLFDGREKYKVFMQSKIVVHPSVFDSGGMASMEAMAFGLPAIGFGLPAYKDYYPQGMLKVREGDREGFSKALLKLLSDNNLYKIYSKQASELMTRRNSWKYRARQTLIELLK